MNFLELKNEVIFRSARSDLSVSYVGSIINEVLEFVDNIHNWSFTNVVEEIVSYPTPNFYELNYNITNIKEIVEIYYFIEGRRLFIHPVDSIERAVSLLGVINNSDESTLISNKIIGGLYYIQNNYIKTYPSSIKLEKLYIEYFKRLNRLINDNDTNFFTEKYPSLIINGALTKVFQYYEVYDVAEVYKNNFELELQNIILRDKKLLLRVKKDEFGTTIKENNK